MTGMPDTATAQLPGNSTTSDGDLTPALIQTAT